MNLRSVLTVGGLSAGLMLLSATAALATGDHGGCQYGCTPPPTTVTVTVTCYVDVPTTVYEEVPTTVYEDVYTTVTDHQTATVTEQLPGDTVTETATVTAPGGTTTVTETGATVTSTVTVGTITTTATETATETAITTAIDVSTATVTAEKTVISVNDVTHEVTKTVIATETVQGDNETVLQVQERVIQPIVNYVNGAPTTSYLTSTVAAAPVLLDTGASGSVESLAYTGLNTVQLLYIGIATVALGGLLLYAAHRRRRPAASHN